MFTPQNFVDQVGPAVSAEWLNAADVTLNFVLNKAQTVAAAQAALGIPTVTYPIGIAEGGSGATTEAGAQLAFGIPNALLVPSAAETAAGIPSNAINFNYAIGQDLRYGAVGNGSTDDTGALTYMFNLANQGVPVYFRALTYAFSAALPQLTASGATVLGCGPDGAHNGGTFPVGTVFKWIGGASSATGVLIGPSVGAANYVSGITFTGITVDCNAGALANGVQVQSTRYSRFDFGVKEAGTVGATFTAITSLTQDPADCQFNRINYRGYQNAAAGTSLVLTGNTTVGAGAANTSFNFFETIDIFHTNTVAINSINSDNNEFEVVRLFHNGAGSATYSWLFQGGTSSGVSARAEQIWKLSCTLPAHWVGATNYSNPPIKIYNLDKGNSSPDPVQDLTGQIFWQTDFSPLYVESWVAYTPTGTSTGTTFGTLTGQYLREAGKCTVQVSVPVTTAGTGTMTISLPPSAPAAAGSFLATGIGYDSITGNTLTGFITASAPTVLTLFKTSSGGYPASSGSILDLTITYQTAN